MKIIYVVESLSKKGGAENAIVNLTIELVKLGHKPSIIHLWGDNDFKEALTSNGISYYSLNLNFRWSILKGLFRLKKILSNLDAKLINAHNFFPMFFVALSKILVRGKKRVVTYHNMGYEVYPANNPYKLLRKELDKILNKFFFDGYIGVSNAVSGSYQNHLGINKFITIENIIPAESIRKIVTKKNSLQDNHSIPNIIMAGRLVHEKGYEYLLESAALLKSQGFNFCIKIFGDGPLKEEILNGISERDLFHQITIIPTVTHEVLFNEISKSKLFVMSSISEGFPMAPAEAMALGIPVVATNVGGIPELIEDGNSGILIPPKNATLLAQAIKEILTNEELRKYIAANGKKRIDQNFSGKILCNKLINYYSEVIS